MAKINILPANIYNRIAAGEVVENPASVVKELVENSIDAGATQIEVYIEQGGKQLIRVVDNGCGIAYDDLQSAFMAHATSKISKAEDLENILTLGFRGEALASISSVSKTRITSKTEKGKCYSLSCNGGLLGKISESVGENGTEVRVETLFYNVPARFKFMKSDKSEESSITNYVSRLICSKPDVAFTYYVDGKMVLQSFGGGMEEAFVSVYGAAALRNCYQINVEKHGIHLWGYIGNQNFSKPNKTYQSLYLNGRYVVNSTLALAIGQAYQSYLMKRQYPFYVLYVDMSPELVDVNVTPNKTDVRFTDNRFLFGMITNVISAVLDGQPKGLGYLVGEASMQTQETVEEQSSIAETPFKVSNPTPQQSVFKRMEELTKAAMSTEPIFDYERAKREIKEDFSALKKKSEVPFPEVEEKKAELQEETPKMSFDEAFFSRRNQKMGKTKAEALREFFPDTSFRRSSLRLDDPGYQANPIDYFAENKKYLASLEGQKQDKIDVSDCVYAGKLFNTYLLYERGDDVYIIDQHAAHERLIFNRLKEQMQNRSVVKQPMLLPYELSLNAFEGDFIREKMQEILSIGFDIEEKADNVFYVTAIPLDLQSMDIASFFHDVLGDVGGYRAIKLEEILKDKLASAACKAAVKGGMDLTQSEIAELFRLMDGDMRLKCPHGRPVVVKWMKKELEKMFKRIV